MPEMTDARRKELRELCEKATPGEWRWRFPVGAIAPELVHPRRGLLLVMDAVRRGMNGATVRFAHRKSVDIGGIMSNAECYCIEAMDPCRPDYPTTTNPDMRFIAAARTALPELLDEIERLRKELEAAHERIEREVIE